MFKLLVRQMLPGIALMRRLRIPSKMTLLGVLLAVPLGLLLHATYRDGQESIETARRELAGTAAVERLVDVVDRTQAHRGLSHRRSYGDETAGLLYDPRAGSHFIMDLLVKGAGPWLESLAVVRGPGTALLARGDASGAERALVLGQASNIRRQLGEVDYRLEALKQAGHDAPPGWEAAREASSRLASHSTEVFTAEALAGEPGVFFDVGTVAIDAAMRVTRHFVERMNQVLWQRIAENERELWLRTGGAIAAVATVFYLALAFYLSFNSSLRALVKGVREVADGDLSRRIEIRGRDELADIGGHVDRDLYVFVVDRHGVYPIHGAKPAMEGRRVHDVPGIDGERFVREAWSAATAPGGGWVEYDIVNPESDQVQPKTSFVVALDDK